MEITANLDAQHYEKLQQLQRALGKDAVELLQEAIDALFVRYEVAVGHDALSILRNSGFVGCLHDDPDLSRNYKNALDWSNKL